MADATRGFLRMLLWEEDGPSHVYQAARWYRRLIAYGFKLQWRAHDSFDPTASWSRHGVHSAWVRDTPINNASGRPTLPTDTKREVRAYRASH